MTSDKSAFDAWFAGSQQNAGAHNNTNANNAPRSWLELVSPDTSTPETSAEVFIPEVQTVPVGTDDEKLILQSGAASITDAILRPESIVAVPSYLLRFVPYYGSASVLVSIALRQASYRHSNDHFELGIYPHSGDSVSVDVAALLRMLGGVISRAKFFRLFKDNKLDWFVTRGEPEHVFKDGRIQRKVNTYQYRGLLLTPGDACDLHNWLLAHDVSSNPMEVLNQALDTNRNTILKFPYRIPDEDTAVFQDAISVLDILRFMLGDQAITPAIASLSDALAAHLIRPESFLAIPWYWFRKVLPELGDDLGVLYLMSKNCCYIDWVKGEDRNTFWVAGGLETLQGWIQSTSLPKRIPQKDPSARGRPRNEEVKSDSVYVRSWRDEVRSLAGQYLCRLDTRQNGINTDWLLEVSEVHLTEADLILRDKLYGFVLNLTDQFPEWDLQSFLSDKRIVTLLHKAISVVSADRICNFETLVTHGICNNETLTTDDICNFETLVKALNCNFETLVLDNICNFDTILNILLRVKHTLFNHKTLQPPHTDPNNYRPKQEKMVVDGYFDKGDWDLNKVLARTNANIKKELINNVSPKAFMSWLIHGALTPQIVNPISFAISRALDTHMDAGGPALRLAELDPQELSDQVWATWQRIQAGYLFDGFHFTNLSPDLKQYLQSADNSADQARMIQRLVDSLGLHVSS